MNILEFAPKNKESILTNEQLLSVLSPLVGRDFVITGKPRTDGSNIRKLVTSLLLPFTHSTALSNEYKIMPPKGKGVPKLLAQLIDTYIVTSGSSYNLQVWNRFPNGTEPLVKYNNGSIITPRDIRYVMVKVDTLSNKIESVVILTPSYIEQEFGRFGKPTIKSQLLINGTDRDKITTSIEKIWFRSDTDNIKSHIKRSNPILGTSHQEATDDSLMPLERIRELVADKLIGMTFCSSDTKTRGQALERFVIESLGYSIDSKLVGGYPDVPNQLLEVKLQDTQTVDLGKYSPQFDEDINHSLKITTSDVRYLIALANPTTLTVEGLVISNGRDLGMQFTYVSDISYKCQRSIPMQFFDKYTGQCRFNP